MNCEEGLYPTCHSPNKAKEFKGMGRTKINEKKITSQEPSL